MVQVTLAEAETDFVALVERAAAGEEVVILKDGSPAARLIPVERLRAPRVPGDIVQVTYIADDFDELDPEIVELFEGRD